MPKFILGLTGLPGCGKGTVAEYLQKRYGASFFKFSAYLTNVLDVMGLERSRENQIKLSEALRAAFGDNALSHAISRDAQKADVDLVVIDGFRRVNDLVKTLEHLPHFRLAAIEAEPRVRYERIVARGEKTDEVNMTWEAFLAQEQRSTEVTVPEVMSRASLHIHNNGTSQELEKELDDLMTQFRITRKD